MGFPPNSLTRYDSYTMHLMNLGNSIVKYWEADKIFTGTQKEMEDQEML